MRIRTDLFEDSYEVYEDLGRFVKKRNKKF